MIGNWAALHYSTSSHERPKHLSFDALRVDVRCFLFRLSCVPSRGRCHHYESTSASVRSQRCADRFDSHGAN